MRYKFSPDFSAGLKVGHNRYRSGSEVDTLTRKTRNQSKISRVFAFGAYRFAKWVSLNVVLGHSENKSRRKLFRATAPTILTPTKSNVFSFITSLNLSRNFGNVRGALALGCGYVKSHRKQSINSIGRVINKRGSYSTLGFWLMDLSYNFRKPTPSIKRISPYIQAGLNRKFTNRYLRGVDGVFYKRSPNSIRMGAGVRISTSNDISMTAGWSRSSGYSGSRSNLFLFSLKTSL